MKKYITKFSTTSEYEAAGAGLDYPNVSLITSDKSIKYVKMKPIPNNQFTYYSTTKVVERHQDTAPGFYPNGQMDQWNKWSANMISHTFENGIGTIIFDGDITSIPSSNGFGGESNLTAIILPGTITSIHGYFAFYNCTSLNSITIPAMTAPTIDSDYLFRDLPDGGTLYILTGATGYDTWMSYLNKWTNNWTISYL